MLNLTKLIIRKDQMGNLVKCRNHVSNVADHEGFPGLKVQDMRGTNPRV